MENILPNGRCFADVTTKMRRAVLTALHSPFPPNDDVIIIISMTTGLQLVEMMEKIS